MLYGRGDSQSVAMSILCRGRSSYCWYLVDKSNEKDEVGNGSMAHAPPAYLQSLFPLVNLCGPISLPVRRWLLHFAET